MRFRFMAAAAATSLLALPLAACADEDDPTADVIDDLPGAEADPEDRVGAAADATLGSGTASFSISIAYAEPEDATDPGGDPPPGPGRDRRTVTDPGDAGVFVEALHVRGDADLDTGLRTMTVTESDDDGVEAVVDGSRLFVERADENGVWSQAVVDDVVDDVDARGAAALVDPGSFLRLLVDGELTEVTRAGVEQVDDDDTDRYAVTVDIGALTLDDEALRVLVEDTELVELELSVWIGDDDHVRAVELEHEGGQADERSTDTGVGADTGARAPGAGGPGVADTGTEGPLVITVEFLDLGEVVTVDVPEGDDVVADDPRSVAGALGLAPIAVSGPDTDGEATLEN